MRLAEKRVETRKRNFFAVLFKKDLEIKKIVFIFAPFFAPNLKKGSRSKQAERMKDESSLTYWFFLREKRNAEIES